MTLTTTWILPVGAAGSGNSSAVDQPEPMTKKIVGKFDVKMTPETVSSKLGEAAPGRFALDKHYHGELEASALGEMLTAMTEVKGSAGYVAIEKVNGRLSGRTGTFWLQHSGLMTRGDGKLSIVVVPDSGTGELVGLTGAMTIKITDSGHFYEFEYTLPSR